MSESTQTLISYSSIQNGVNNLRLILSNIPYGLEGSYTLTIAASLEDYQDVNTSSISTLVIVEEGRIPCTVLSLN